MPNHVAATEMKTERPLPKTVLTAKRVDFCLVSYADETGLIRTQPAIVGDNQVFLLDARTFGLGNEPTPVGYAKDWLRVGVQKLLNDLPEVE